MRDLLAALFICVFFGLYSCGYSDSADFLIPKNYRGRVAVVFNQPKGQKPMYLSGRRIYEIPLNGILLTQFAYKPGYVDYKYFLVDDKGKRMLLPNYKYDYNNDGTVHYLVQDSNKVGIFGHGTSVAYASDGSAPGLEVFVSTFNGLDTVETMQHFDQRVDSLLGLSN
jgi:hypothetical protein